MALATAGINLRYRPLWEDYWKDRSSGEALWSLMNAFIPLVKRVLRRISIRLPSHIEREDLLQSALVGLFEAIERFDPDHKGSFDAFASRRIRGAILDELRKDDIVSRGVRGKIKKIRSSADELMTELGRVPEDDEIAQRSGMELDEMNRLMEIASPMVYLDDIVLSGNGKPVLLKDVIDAQETTPAEQAEKKDMMRHLAKAFRSLADREQKVIYLYYHEFLRVKEIAALFEVSEARVCQIHSMALMKLKVLMGG